MDPMTVLAAAQAAMGIGQMVKGAIGSSKDAPTMEIPKSATQALGIAKTQAGAREMPGQKIMEDKLASQAGAAANKMMQMSGGSGAALGGVAQVQQNLNDAMGNMQVQQAGFVAGRQDALRGELGNMAQWENQQFQMNEFQPYLQRMQASAQLKDAGMKNLWGSASEFVKGQQTKDMWDQYIGLQQGKIDADREASGALFNMGKMGSGGQTLPQTPPQGTPQAPFSFSPHGGVFDGIGGGMFDSINKGRFPRF